MSTQTDSTALLAPVSFGDSTQIDGRHTLSPFTVPLPPESLQWSVGSTSIENFLQAGNGWAQLIDSFAPEQATVFDVGCGCGRVARALIGNKRIERYIGFDVIRENIGWCRQYLEPSWNERASFYWFDVYSATYNPKGVLAADNVVFLCETGAADIVFACSVFTHLLEPDAVHYLQEVRRVLSRRGKAILSIHAQTPSGKRFVGNEARIDIDPAYFVDLARKAGLEESERREPNDPDQQTIFVFVPGEMPAVAAHQGFNVERLTYAALASELVALQKESRYQLDSQLEAKLADIRSRLMAADGEISTLRNELSKEGCRLESVEARLADTDVRYQAEQQIRRAIENSISWRITRPGRSLMRLFRSLR